MSKNDQSSVENDPTGILEAYAGLDRMARNVILTAATAGAALFAGGVLTLSKDFNDAAPVARKLATYIVGMPTVPFTKAKLDAHRIPAEETQPADIAKLATYAIGMPTVPFTKGKLEAYRDLSGNFNTSAPNTISPNTEALLTYAIGAPTMPFTYKEIQKRCAQQSIPCKKQ